MSLDKKGTPEKKLILHSMVERNQHDRCLLCKSNIDQHVGSTI